MSLDPLRDLKDRVYLASETFLFEALVIARNAGWQNFTIWALRARIEMQIGAVESVREVLKKLEGEASEAVIQLGQVAKSTRLDAERFRRLYASGDQANECQEAIRLMHRFSRRLAALRDDRSIDEIEKKLVGCHREMMLSGFERWLPSAPVLEDITSVPEHSLGAIAFSGGGIRSASFSLGVIGSLANQLMLPAFHYISGVSGGGYIASWLTAWAYRKNGGIEGVQESLVKEGANCGPIQWVRRYSSYLVPRPGLLATDTWALIVSYIRNWLPILFVVLAIVGFLLLIPKVVVSLAEWGRSAREFGAWFPKVVLVGCLGWIVLFLSMMRYLTIFDKFESYPESNPRVPYFVAVGACGSAIALAVLLPISGLALDSYVPILALNSLSVEGRGKIIFVWVLLYFSATLLAFCVVPVRHLARKIGGRLLKRTRWYARKYKSGREVRYRVRAGYMEILIGPLFGGLTGGGVLAAIYPILPMTGAKALVVVIPLVVVGVFGLAEIVVAMAVGSHLTDKARAWSSRLGGWILGSSIVWVLLCLLSLGAGGLQEVMGGWRTALVGTAVLGVAIIITGRFARKSYVKTACSAVLSLLFIFLFTAAAFDPALKSIANSFESHALVLFFFLVLVLIAIRTTDLNRLSLHAI